MIELLESFKTEGNVGAKKNRSFYIPALPARGKLPGDAAKPKIIMSYIADILFWSAIFLLISFILFF